MIINTNSIILLYLLVRSVLRNKDKQNFRAIKNKKQKKILCKIRRNMETDVKSRIIKFLKYKNISASQFSQQIGASRNYVSSMSKSVQPDKLHSISIQFPELNIEWLLIGKGEMLLIICPTS